MTSRATSARRDPPVTPPTVTPTYFAQHTHTHTYNTWSLSHAVVDDDDVASGGTVCMGPPPCRHPPVMTGTDACSALKVANHG
jgi:hypothetical protein